MTKIKTAQAWAFVDSTHIDVQLGITDIQELDGDELVIIVHGLTEAEVHEAAALLEKSREVCEWGCGGGEWLPPTKCSVQGIFLGDAPNYCPSCGRKVVVK